MKTGPDGIKLMHHFESCRLKAYPDPATGGDPWTIGWGETGAHVYKGMVITQEQADLMFENRLQREFEPGVQAAITSGCSQRQFDALVAFAFNVGLGNLRSSTLLRMHNAGRYEDAAQQFNRWDKAAGKVMKGLQRRRHAEKCVYQGSEAGVAIALALAAFP